MLSKEFSSHAIDFCNLPVSIEQIVFIELIYWITCVITVLVSPVLIAREYSFIGWLVGSF